MIVVVVSLSGETGELVSGPDIITRGFVYVKESESLMEELREVALEALDACQVRGIHGLGHHQVRHQGRDVPLPLQEDQAQPHDPAGDHGGVMPGVCPPGKTAPRIGAPAIRRIRRSAGALFCPAACGKSVAKPWENLGVPLANQGLNPEEGSEPGALCRHDAVCHVMSTGAVTITDADDISPQYAEAAEVLTGMVHHQRHMKMTPSSRKTPLSAPKLPR